MVLNSDYTRKQLRHIDLGKSGLHRNGLVDKLREYVCVILSVHGGDTIKVKRCTLISSYIPNDAPPNPPTLHDRIPAWEIDLEDWVVIDIHRMKSLKVEV